jgi:hypothetical protein
MFMIGYGDVTSPAQEPSEFSCFVIVIQMQVLVSARRSASTYFAKAPATSI